MTRIYSFLVYLRHPPKSVTGILGTFQFHSFSFLLAAGKRILTEPFEGTPTEALAWYCDNLREQGMTVVSSRIADGSLWIEVSPDTPLDEYLTAEEVEETDTETLAWRRVWYPVADGKECLGFAVSHKEFVLGSHTKGQITMDAVLQTLCATPM